MHTLKKAWRLTIKAAGANMPDIVIKEALTTCLPVCGPGLRSRRTEEFN